MSHSEVVEKTPSVFKKLPEEKFLFVIDLYALSKSDIDFSPSNLEPMSSLSIILRGYRIFALQKLRFQNNSFGICVLTRHSFKLVMDFTSNINIIIEKLSSISIENEKFEEVATYDFDCLLKSISKLREFHKNSIFRVIMTYNRDNCLPIIKKLDKNIFNMFCSPTFYFDIVYVCKNDISTDEMAQIIYAKLSLLCSPLSYKICVQRKPMSIINGITTLLSHPHTRKRAI